MDLNAIKQSILGEVQKLGQYFVNQTPQQPSQPQGNAVATKWGNVPFQGPTTAYAQSAPTATPMPTATPIPNNYNPSKDPNNMKLTVGVSPNFVNEQRGGMGADTPQIQPSPTISSKPWTSKFSSIWDQAVQNHGIDPVVKNLIARSENGREIANYANLNRQGNVAGTFDIGLTQVNVDPGQQIKNRILNDTRNMNQSQANEYINKLIDQGVITGEAAQLRDPSYSINKAVQLYKTRLQNLGDPVLAIASYNLGSGGAVLNPEEAINRARYVYNNAGYELPDTPFTRDPHGFVKANISKYKQLGLFK